MAPRLLGPGTRRTFSSCRSCTRDFLKDEDIHTCRNIMAKRPIEEEDLVDGAQPSGEIQPAAKKVKKDKKKRNGTADEPDTAALDLKAEKKKRKEEKRAKKEADNVPAAVEESANGAVDEKAAKAARKALKRAKKEAERAAEAADGPPGSEDVADVVKPSSKTEKKSSKHTKETEGKSSSKQQSPSSNGHASHATDGSGYTEDPALSSLSQSEVDKFIAEKFITVTNPDDNPTVYRPITSFDYLTIKDPAQRAPFKSYTTPTPIQAAAWPYLFAGRDVIGVAETGSGKTMAFGVPCIRSISSLGAKDQKRGIRACIVSPTRELALQIHEQLVKLATPAGLKVACVYGGVNKDQQRETLRGVSAIVATPGRLNDFINEGSIDLSNVGYLVLDEADRMLDKGFEEEMRKIISTTPSKGRQTLMFTATWPPIVRELASTFMKSPVRVTIGDNPTGELRANTSITQEVEVIDPYAKNDRLLALLKQYQSGKNKGDRILVFCLYKKEATRIEGFIRSRGFEVAGIHGDLSQQQRTASLEAFKQGKVPLLVATDVAARGLDIPAVKVVINVTFPLTIEDYVHRIGR